MSRSYIKNNYLKITGYSNKKSRRRANKRFRKISRIKLDEAPKKVREIYDNYDFASDGLAMYFKDPDPVWLVK